ncbi:hypothetical protein EDD53_0434 [Pacificibacter maritimus]|uniref:Lipoprotein n=1 Tax=Pacificibacter maritimus TaxID=762213 RepID=A0A3N4UMS2_9RHOB|nr:hypothetical protein [Pacificibacter maritimus]RPE71318.1 hypothetical protein EDD53_0434 [Pacificibacter maritimus]
MQRQVIMTALALSLLSGCASFGTSRLNPVNWFGPSQAVPATQQGQKVTVVPTLAPKRGYPEFQDTRLLVPSLADVSIVKSASGAIVTATGLVPSLGYYDAELVRIETDNPAELLLDFRLRAPSKVTAIGNEAQRKITVARTIQDRDLQNISTITVRASNGSRVIRR